MCVCVCAVPVIRTHGPLDGIVSRTELVDVQDKKLDEFHLKDQINKISDDLDQVRDQPLHGSDLSDLRSAFFLHSSYWRR